MTTVYDKNNMTLSTNSTATDPSTIDYKNSETNSNFKQKLKNNYSRFIGCSNVFTETIY
jgi:hypothetical protein